MTLDLPLALQQRFLDTFVSDLRAFFYFCVVGVSIESKEPSALQL